MNKDYDPMAINWTQVNVPTILAVAGAAWAIFSYVGDLDKRIEKQEQYRDMRSTQTDNNFAEVKRNISDLRADIEGTKQAMQNVPYRMGVVENGLIEQGKRVDRLSELILNGMDGVRKDVNTLGTKVEVLSNKLDNAFPQRKTELTIPQRSGVPARN